MANYTVEDTQLTSIANAIRTKGGTSASLTFPTDFVSAIENIPTASSPVLQAKTVVPTTSPETVTADSGYDGLSSVTIQLPVYAGEHHSVVTGYTVRISLTNPKNSGEFGHCDIAVDGNITAHIYSPTGSVDVVANSNISVIIDGMSVDIPMSGITCTGGVSNPTTDSMGGINFVITGDGTITFDGIDYDD